MLSGGGNHSVAINSDGHCLAWGNMDAGQLGIGFTQSQLADHRLIRRKERSMPLICLQPTPVLDIGEVRYAACGTAHTRFINSDGLAFAAGYGSEGQLGLGDEEEVSKAKQITKGLPENIDLVWAGAGAQFSIVGSRP